MLIFATYSMDSYQEQVIKKLKDLSFKLLVYSNWISSVHKKKYFENLYPQLFLL
jgi:hypothetical protein